MQRLIDLNDMDDFFDNLLIRDSGVSSCNHVRRLVPRSQKKIIELRMIDICPWN